jgi:hypothetical protein
VNATYFVPPDGLWVEEVSDSDVLIFDEAVLLWGFDETALVDFDGMLVILLD